jgi:hypothetical protein
MSGVRKYRSVEEMPGPPPRRPLDPDNLRLAFGLMDLARRLGPLRYVPGVRKFASHAEMIRTRERSEVKQARAARSRRSGSPP